MVVMPRMHPLDESDGTPSPAPPPPAPRGPAADPAVLADLRIAEAREALAERRPEEALRLLRQASVGAPFRPELRELMSAALELRSGVGAGAETPRPVRPRSRPPRVPLLPPDPARAPEPARIEAIHFDAPDASEADSEAPTVVPGSTPEAANSLPADLDARAAHVTPVPLAPHLAAHDAPTVVPGLAPPGRARRRSDSVPPGRVAARPAFVSRPARAPRRAPSTGAWIAAAVGAVALTAGCTVAAWRLFRSERVGAGAAVLAGAAEIATPAPREEARATEFLERAERYAEQSQFALAIEQLEMLPDVVERDRRVAEMHARQGALYLDADRWNDARKSYEQALLRAPSSDEYAVRLGQVLYKIGRYEKSRDPKRSEDRMLDAERNFNGALDLNADNVGALEGLARIAASRDDRETAVQHYRRLLSIAPDGPEAKDAIKTLKSWGLKP